MSSDFTVLSDPVHGSIKVPRDIIEPLLESREVQRLRRIKQLGMGMIVFPAAEHSRFPHALGAMSLVSDALESLVDKGLFITNEEKMAAMAAILLHDIGHTPFSHTLEYKLVLDTPHEAISKALIQRLKLQHSGETLDMALQMLNQEYKPVFFGHLISSQLDMDRLDYLCRDSHFTGVVEGRIGTERILRTLCVHPQKREDYSSLAVESKGVYAVENVLTARRLMYWQVYLHKTVIAADFVLRGAIQRARELIHDGNHDAVSGISPSLKWFIEQNVDQTRLEEDEVLDQFLNLDDTEVLHSLKQWCHSKDPILADLSQRIITRDLLRCTFLPERPDTRQIEIWKEQVTHALKKMKITIPEAHKYYFTSQISKHAAYKPEEEAINVLDPKGNLCPLDQLPDGHAMKALTQYIQKPYICYLKSADLTL